MNPETTTFPTALARMFWMMIGPMALLLLLIGIASSNRGWFTPADIGFLAVLVGMLLARTIEFRAGNPQTSTGEPATSADLRPYLIGTLLVGLGVWVVGNLMGNYWLGR